jgi:predicted RNA methylase
LYYRVLAGAEHRNVLNRDLATVIDIGANRGQFALAVRRWAPSARVVSFEPLPGPSSIFRKVFASGDQMMLHRPASECDKVVLSVNRYGDNDNIADPVNFNRLSEPLAA